ncbi:hypothetical protein FRB95_001797 [Tulasnella sp. JGI-2019a]|nr:hypothetical protein FRB95_001797 [Tulasnella sp. JGI-2019a]
MWFSTVLALLITWLAQGRPHYVSMSDGQTIAYIFDVAADILKPLFIVGCVFTAVGFFLSLFIERWLRHSGRLLPEHQKRERVMSALACFGAALGGCGLILLSIFDTKRHPSIHRLFLLIFVLGVALSAIFTVIEFRWLNKDFGENVAHLKGAYILKAILAGLLIILAIAFAICLYRAQNPAAILEWTISFGYTFYLLTFWLDLRQSKGVSKGELLDYDNQTRMGGRLGGYRAGGYGMRNVGPASTFRR